MTALTASEQTGERHGGDRCSITGARGAVGLIVAGVAVTAGAISQTIYSAILGMIIITTIIAPLLLRNSCDKEIEEDDKKEIECTPHSQLDFLE